MKAQVHQDLSESEGVEGIAGKNLGWSPVPGAPADTLGGCCDASVTEYLPALCGDKDGSVSLLPARPRLNASQ